MDYGVEDIYDKLKYVCLELELRVYEMHMSKQPKLKRLPSSIIFLQSTPTFPRWGSGQQ